MIRFNVILRQSEQYASKYYCEFFDRLSLAASQASDDEKPLISLAVSRGISALCVSLLYQHMMNAAPVEREMPQAYCVKCKANIEIKNPQNVTLKNGKPAIKGVCPNCGTSVFRIGKA